MDNKSKKFNKIDRGFIQIPILLAFLILGTVATSAGYYSVQHSKKQEVVKNSEIRVPLDVGAQQEEKSTAQSSVNSEETLSLKTTTPIVVKTEQKYSSNTEGASNTKKAEELAGKMSADLRRLTYIDNLNKDIEDFELLLKAVQTSKEQYISFAENSAGKRSGALSEFLVIATSGDVRSFAQSLIDGQHKHKNEARDTYVSLFNILENEFSAYLNSTRGIKEKIAQNQFSGDVDSLLFKDAKEKERFIGLLTRVNEIAQGLEQKKSDNFTEELGYLRNLVLVSEVATSLSQQLSQIEQKAQQISIPQFTSSIKCYTTTNDHIFDPSRTYSTRCEPDTTTTAQKCAMATAARISGGVYISDSQPDPACI